MFKEDVETLRLLADTVLTLEGVRVTSAEDKVHEEVTAQCRACEAELIGAIRSVLRESDATKPPSEEYRS